MLRRTRALVALLAAVLVIITSSGTGRVVAEGVSCRLSADELTRADDVISEFWRLGILGGRGPELDAEWIGSTTTRAEFSVLLVRALSWEVDEDVYAVPFADMDPHWAGDSVAALAQEGIVKGEPSGTFRPDAPITLAEAQVMLARTLRGGTGIGLENAGAALKAIGMETEFSCTSPDTVNHGQALLMLDRAMRIPLYARHAKP